MSGGALTTCGPVEYRSSAMAFFRRKLRPVLAPTRGPVLTPRHEEAPTALGSAPVPAVDGALRVLVVCTANICRSPLGEALLAHVFEARGIPAVVRSAGVAGSNLSTDPRSVRYAAQLGQSLTEHRARKLDRQIIGHDGADLVLTMSREHLREVAVIDPDAVRRTFTLREFVRRSGSAPAHAEEGFAEWVGRIGTGRKATDLLGDDTPDDILDPYGRSDAAFQSVAAEIESLAHAAVSALAVTARA